MFEKIASQVQPLTKSVPLRPFRPDKMKIALIGNCVVNKIGALLRDLGSVDPLFTSNLCNWGSYHKDTFFDRASEAECVVALAGGVGRLRHTEEELVAHFGSKIIFVPLVWIEGLDTLQAFGEEGMTQYSGGKPVAQCIRENGVEQTFNALARGTLRTKPVERFRRSLELTRSREARALKIADFIEDRYQVQKLMNSIGHPSGEIVLELFSKLCRQLGLMSGKAQDPSPLLISQASLPPGPRVFTPYDVEELGLKYTYDPDWMLQAKSMVTMMGNALRSGNLKLGETDAELV